MAKKDFTLTSKILMSLLAAGDMALVTPFGLRKRLRQGNVLGKGENAAQIIYYLAQKGLVKYVNINNKRFIKLTKHGQLEALLARARLPDTPKKWDKKWRIIMFDIPEESENKRSFFRALLRKNGFVQLQHSVYISPYPLNREAVRYLNETGLISFIRILKVEEMDDDKDLRKKFKLI